LPFARLFVDDDDNSDDDDNDNDDDDDDDDDDVMMIGIPRLRELLMTASSSIKTPQMILPFLPATKPAQQFALCQALRRVDLEEIVANVEVVESYDCVESGIIIIIVFLIIIVIVIVNNIIVVIAIISILQQMILQFLPASKPAHQFAIV